MITNLKKYIIPVIVVVVGVVVVYGVIGIFQSDTFITFTYPGWGYNVSEMGVVEGDRISINYDIRRFAYMYTLEGDYDLTLFYQIDDGEILSSDTSIDFSALPSKQILSEDPYESFSFIIPKGSDQITLWFSVSNGERVEYDSNLGENYIFEVSSRRS